MVKRINFFLVILFLIFSCKSKSATTSNNTVKEMSASKVIRNHYDNSFKQKTMVAKLKVKYRGKNNLPGVTASLRMEKDKTIWISLSKLGFPIGKALITKDRVSYYEKINKTYFEGDFTLLSNWLGTDLDYEKVQNLLLGEAILNLRKEKHFIKADEKGFQLYPKKPYELFDVFYFVNTSNFKLNSQQVKQVNLDKQLIINYNEYEKIGDEIFPKKILITANDNKYITTVDIEYRSVEFNKSVYFPFSIPEGYKEIELK